MTNLSTQKRLLNTASLSITLIASLAILSGCTPKTDTKAKMPMASTETNMMMDGMVLPASTENAEALKHYKAGWADFENSRGLSANQHFLAAAKADPSFAMAHMMSAWTANSTEGFVTNVGLASAHMDGASEGEKLLVTMIQSFMDNDDEGATAAAKSLTEIHPDSPRAWDFLANAYTNTNDVSSARAAYLKAIGLDPTYVPGHINLGNNLLTQEPKDFAGAEKHFKHAIALTPNEPNPYDLLGDVHRAQNNLKAAYNDYTKAAELAPELGSGLQQRGHVNSFMGNYAEARADYSAAADLEDARGSGFGPGFRVFGAYVNLHEGKHDAAIAELQAIADKSASSTQEGAQDTRVNALINIAIIAIEDGNDEVAGKALRDASATQLQQADALDSKSVRDNAGATRSHFEGLLSARMKDSEAAAMHAGDFAGFVATSNNPQKLQRMHNILGMNAYYQGDFEAAVTHLEQGTTLNNMYIKYYLARAHEQAGNKAEAKKLYKEMSVYNFNGPAYAMFRKDIVKRAAG